MHLHLPKKQREGQVSSLILARGVGWDRSALTPTIPRLSLIRTTSTEVNRVHENPVGVVDGVCLSIQQPVFIPLATVDLWRSPP